MVHIKDEGSYFDAPLDTVWKYVQDGERHNATHQSRNYNMKPLGENVMELSWEANMNGNWQKVKTRTTVLAPLGLAIEMIEGPMAGSKFVNLYTPAGNRTGITVIGDFASKSIPAAQLEGAVRGFLDQVYTEDAAVIKGMAQHK